MNKLFKLIILTLTAAILQACLNTTPLYQAKPPFAELIIDAPNDYDSTLAITIYDREPDFWRMDDPLLYGFYDSVMQPNNRTKIKANQKIFLMARYGYKQACALHFPFLPVAGKIYRLTVGVVRDKDKEGLDKCYVSIAELKNGKLFPINLNKQ